MCLHQRFCYLFVREGCLTIHKCSAVYMAESVFAMLTVDFEIVRSGARLGFVLNFYQSHA